MRRPLNSSSLLLLSLLALSALVSSCSEANTPAESEPAPTATERISSEAIAPEKPPVPVEQAEESSEVTRPLSRTRRIVAGKIESLSTYNLGEFTGQEILGLMEHNVGHPVDEAAWAQLSELMTSRLIPATWTASQEVNSKDRIVSLRAMTEVVEAMFPQRLMENADVLLFPESAELRIISPEQLHDHLRDSAWHWRWIGDFIDETPVSSLETYRELDIYAIDLLSELLSVISMATVELAARPLPDGTRITAEHISNIYAKMENEGGRAPEESGEELLPGSQPAYSSATREGILSALPSSMFTEVSSSAGPDFVHVVNPDLKVLRSEAEIPLGIAGGGVAVGDFNGDGISDAFLCGDDGGRLYQGTRSDEGETKFRFVDVTHGLGVVCPYETRAAYFIDYDNDGFQDLFLTTVLGPNFLFRNDQNRFFVDVTDETGLGGGEQVTHEAVWFDMDNDGLLDVYVANFALWTHGKSPSFSRENDHGLPNQLFHHQLVDGKHVFVEIGKSAGVDDSGWTHCVGAFDYDEDGLPDLFSMNDFGACQVYRNLGGQRFEEVSRDIHFDGTYNAMNFSLLHRGGAESMDVYVSLISKLTHRQRYRRPNTDTEAIFTEANIRNLRTFFANRLLAKRADADVYDNIIYRVFEPAPEPMGWTWDASPFDYENDGDQDLLVLNGTESGKAPTRDDEQRQEWIYGRAYLERHGNQRNATYISEDGYFYEVLEQSELSYVGNSRSSAYFDMDEDGDLDVLINDFEAPSRLFQNNQNTENRWVALHLVGTKSNRDAIGARVALTAGGETQRAIVVSRSGFLCQNPKTLHFGLGTADKVDTVTIRWPSGTKQELTGLDAGKKHKIVEPNS
jgi:enediyne biosynthesis protein E4